jgi:hypothetical protein
MTARGRATPVVPTGATRESQQQQNPTDAEPDNCRYHHYHISAVQE